MSRSSEIKPVYCARLEMHASDLVERVETYLYKHGVRKEVRGVAEKIITAFLSHETPGGITLTNTPISIAIDAEKTCYFLLHGSTVSIEISEAWCSVYCAGVLIGRQDIYHIIPEAVMTDLAYAEDQRGF